MSDLPSSPPLLSLNVQRRRGDFTVDVNIKAGPGVTTLFGKSGAGKSTIVAMLAGLIKPDSGHIRIGEQTLFDSAQGIDVPPERRQVGYVFQDARLFPHMSVMGNLRYGLNRLGTSKHAETFKRVVALLGLDHLLDRRPANLSGGEKQRVAIGRALLSNPRILLMDEPLASLDAARKSEILPYIERLSADFEMPVVYVSHAVEEVVRLSDTLVLISNGCVAAQGDVEDIMGRIDLGPLTGRYEAGAVLNPTVGEHIAQHRLTKLSLLGHAMFVPMVDLPLGASVRLRVRARDVSLALTRPVGTSILNIVPCTVREIDPGSGPHVEIALNVSPHETALGLARATPQTVLARITQKSLTDMQLEPGKPVHALIKAVAIDRHSLGGHGAGTKRA